MGGCSVSPVGGAVDFETQGPLRMPEICTRYTAPRHHAASFPLVPMRRYFLLSPLLISTRSLVPLPPSQ